MADVIEPADGSYVSVRTGSDTFEIWRHRDDWADHGHLGDSHWFCRTDATEPALTWADLTCRGPIAYVGEFVQRRAA